MILKKKVETEEQSNISDPQVGRGPTVCAKTFEKSRFNKTCTTLTTILPREKMQLSKVLSLLKRFGHPMEAPCKNRDFVPKFRLTELCIQTIGAQEPLQFEYKAQ